MFPTVNLVLSMCAVPFCAWIVPQRVKGASFMHITSNLSNCIFFGSNVYAALIFVNLREEIRSLLQSKTRMSQKVIQTLICAVPSFSDMLRQMSSACCVSTIIANVLFAHSYFTLTCFFILYTDIVVELTVRNEQILDWARRTDRNSFDPLIAKWEIRDRIGKLNSIFANLLPLYYVEYFLLLMRFSADLLEGLPDPTGYALMFLMIVGITLPLFELSRRSTYLTSISMSTEYVLSNRFPPETQTDNALAVLRFREYFDVSMIAVYAHGVPNFLRFLSFSITCIAVVLQFDYNIQQRIST